MFFWAFEVEEVGVDVGAEVAEVRGLGFDFEVEFNNL